MLWEKEMMFMKHYAPYRLLVKKGLKHKSRLKCKASSSTTRHPISAELT